MKNIEFLTECLSCLHEVFLWQYDKDGLPVSTTCPDSTWLNDPRLEKQGELFRQYAELHSRPSLITGAYSTMWLIASEKKDGIPEVIYAVGPFFTDSFPKEQIRKQLEEEHMPIRTAEKLMNQLNRLSVISFYRVLEYAIMIHYAVTGEKIDFFELHYDSQPAEFKGEHTDDSTQFHGTYEAEKELMRMVRNGDMNVLNYLKRVSSVNNVGKLASDNSEPLRQLKNTVLVGITLFSRAAIEGGLYPDTALTLTDHYFQAVEAADSFQEISNITMTMQHDFVGRVHKIRNTSKHSRPVQMLIDYIYLHLEDELSIAGMADIAGYTDYYLSKKFRKETGMTIKEFIRNARLEKAQSYLQDPAMTVREVSERLRFTSQSYFIDCFRKKYGITPGEYQMHPEAADQ